MTMYDRPETLPGEPTTVVDRTEYVRVPSNNSNKGDFMLGLLVGASVGAALALLYAPASGTETRRQVKNVAGDAMEKASEVAAMTKDRAQDMTSTVKDRAQDMTSTVKDKASDVASRVKSQAQKAAETVQKNAQTPSQGGGNWAAQLPSEQGDHQTGHRDQNELRTSDAPEVVADRVNNAMQGSGEEAHQIAHDLAEAPKGRRDPTV